MPAPFFHLRVPVQDHRPFNVFLVVLALTYITSLLQLYATEHMKRLEAWLPRRIVAALIWLWRVAMALPVLLWRVTGALFVWLRHAIAVLLVVLWLKTVALLVWLQRTIVVLVVALRRVVVRLACDALPAWLIQGATPLLILYTAWPIHRSQHDLMPAFLAFCGLVVAALIWKRGVACVADRTD